MRRWSAEALGRAPQWTLRDPAIGVVVPDSTDRLGGQRAQRYVKAATIFPDGEILLLLAGSAETRTILADASLAEFSDLADPERTRHGRIPPMAAGWGRPWSEGGRIARAGDEAVLAGRPFEGMLPPRSPDLELNYVDPQGRLTRPSMLGKGFRGALLGSFADGSLLVAAAAGLNELVQVADTVASMPFGIARTRPGSDVSGETIDFQPLFTAGVLTARGGVGMVPGAHTPWTVATTSGEMVWVAPSERPELVAMDRSGDVLLVVAWDAGDRETPPGDESWHGLARHPAVAAVVAGADGRIFVQRFGSRDGRPVRGPEWLVFGPAGDLIARLDVPTGLRVLAFGPGTALVVATAAAGHAEVRLHAIDGAEG